MRAIVTMTVVFGVTLIGVAARPAAQTQDQTSARALYALLNERQPQSQQGQQGQGQQGQPQGRGPQGPPKNLQVLPKDWTTQQVVAFMGTVRTGLGVQCTFCHEQDRSLDTKPEKVTARKMIAMMLAVNDQLKDIGDPAPAGTYKVTCYTCHRGMQKPISAPPSGGGGGF
jgi:hypothetical protein